MLIHHHLHHQIWLEFDDHHLRHQYKQHTLMLLLVEQSMCEVQELYIRLVLLVQFGEPKYHYLLTGVHHKDPRHHFDLY
jgi:hypothetical protein